MFWLGSGAASTRVLVETLRHTLNVLATVVPEWLSEITPADWFDCYSSRIEASQLPRAEAESQQWLLQLGADGHHLLREIYDPTAPMVLALFQRLNPTPGLGATILYRGRATILSAD